MVDRINELAYGLSLQLRASSFIPPTTDCMGRCKSNYFTITAMTAPFSLESI